MILKNPTENSSKSSIFEYLCLQYSEELWNMLYTSTLFFFFSSLSDINSNNFEIIIYSSLESQFNSKTFLAVNKL